MLDFIKIHKVEPLVEVYKFADAQLAVNSLANGTPHYPRYRAVLETGSFMENFTPNPN